MLVLNKFEKNNCKNNTNVYGSELERLPCIIY